MDLSCEASALSAAFSAVHAILPERDEHQPVNYVTIAARSSHFASVLAMNELGAALRVDIECDVKTTGSAAFPFLALYRAIAFLGEAQLRITVGERLIGKIRCKSYAAQVAGIDPRLDPSVFDYEPLKAVFVRSDELRRALKQTIIAASDEDSVLNGVLFELTSSGVRLFATDRTRIAASSVTPIREDEVPPSRGAVPRRAISALSKLLPSTDVPVGIQLDENRITLEWQQTTLRAPLYAAHFPDAAKIMPASCEFETTIRTTRLRGVIGAVAPIATDKYHTVEIRCSQRKLLIQADSPEIGFAKDKIDLTENGQDFSLAFNGHHLMQFLESVESRDVVFGVKWKKADGAHAVGCMLRPVGRQDYLYYIAPIVRGSI